MSRAAWWKDLFDADDLRLWEGMGPSDALERQTVGLWERLGAAARDQPSGLRGSRKSKRRKSTSLV